MAVDLRSDTVLMVSLAEARSTAAGSHGGAR
jgi:hypothetical protein